VLVVVYVLDRFRRAGPRPVSVDRFLDPAAEVVVRVIAGGYLVGRSAVRIVVAGDRVKPPESVKTKSLVSRICGFEAAQEAVRAGDIGRFRSFHRI